MFLVQLLLPLHDNTRRLFPRESFDQVRSEITERFGGVTAYVRAPAEGAWQDAHGKVLSDEVVVIEVMCDTLDRKFWSEYRQSLTQRFEQEEVVVRAMPFESL
jgi:hypothetical protein